MTDLESVRSEKSWLPNTGHGLWRICLMASLMINLIILGLILGHNFRRNPIDRASAANYLQFVPQRFFGELSRERRKELGDAFRENRNEFDSVRKQSSINAEKIATELQKPDYDAVHVGALVDEFTTGPNSMAAKSGAMLKSFYAKLSADERALLAKSIQDRATHRK